MNKRRDAWWGMRGVILASRGLSPGYVLYLRRPSHLCCMGGRIDLIFSLSKLTRYHIMTPIMTNTTILYEDKKNPDNKSLVDGRLHDISLR